MIGNDCFCFLLVSIALNIFTAPLPYRCSVVPEYASCVNKLRQNIGLQTWIRRHIVTTQIVYSQ